MGAGAGGCIMGFWAVDGKIGGDGGMERERGDGVDGRRCRRGREMRRGRGKGWRGMRVGAGLFDRFCEVVSGDGVEGEFWLGIFPVWLIP